MAWSITRPVAIELVDTAAPSVVRRLRRLPVVAVVLASAVIGCKPQPAITAGQARAHPECLVDDDLPEHCERDTNPNAAVIGIFSASVGVGFVATGWLLQFDPKSEIDFEPMLVAGVGLVAIGVPLIIYGLRDENPYVDALEEEAEAEAETQAHTATPLRAEESNQPDEPPGTALRSTPPLPAPIRP